MSRFSPMGPFETFVHRHMGVVVVIYLILIMVCMGLSGCAAGPSLFTLNALTKSAPTQTAPVAPTNPVCPASALADVPPRPEPAKGAGFPKPKTKAGSDAVDAYLSYLHSLSDWADAGWARVVDIQSFCTTPVKP